MKSAIDLYVINKIKEKRKEEKYSQRGLAEVLKCSSGLVGLIESPKYPNRYTIHQIYLIAKEFDCSPADFFPPTDSNEFDF